MYKLHLGIFFFILFFISLPSFLHYKFKDKTILFLWIILPLVVFTALKTKDARYLLPTYPALAIISAMGLLRFRAKAIKIIFLIIVLLFGTFNFIYLSYYKDLDKSLDKFFLWGQRAFLIYKPVENNWQQTIERFVYKIKPDDISSDIHIALLPFGITLPDMKVAMTQYFLKLNNPQIKIYTFTHFGETMHFIDNKDNFNYLLVITSEQGVDFRNFDFCLEFDYPYTFTKRDLQQEVSDIIASFFDRFKVIDSARLSPGEDIHFFLYKNS